MGEHGIPAGYYFSSFQNSSLAIRYQKTQGCLALELFVDETRIITDWKAGETSFRVCLKRKRFLYSFMASEDPQMRGTLVKSSIPKKGKDRRYDFQCSWPNENFALPRLEFSTCSSEDVYTLLRKEGVAIVSKVYQEEELQRIFNAFHQPGKKFNKRGWYAFSRSIEESSDIAQYLDTLIEPLIPYLNHMLGEEQWEHNNTLQVAFADRSRTSAIPTYHVDKMFLNKGEPFSLLVGVPLAGDLDLDLSGNLSVIPRSHLILQDVIKRTETSILEDSSMDKNVKLRKCFNFAGDSNIQPACLKAIPTDVQLCHYRIIHGVEKNFQSQRAIAYIRIRIKKHSPKRLQHPKIPDWKLSVQQYECWDLWEPLEP